MNRFKSEKALRIFAICAAGVAVLSAVLRLISILFFYDADIGYYKSGAVLPIIAQALPALATIAAVVFTAVPKLSVKPLTPENTFTARSLAIFPAAGFSAYAVLYLLNLAQYLGSLDVIVPKAVFWNILFAVAFVCAAVFFWLTFLGKSLNSSLFVGLGVGAVVSFVAFLATSYFDTLVQMNSPNKTVFHFAILGTMLLTVNEMRIGIPQKKPSFHLFSAAVAAIYATTSSLPSIICSIAGKMPVNYALIFEDGVLLACAVFAFARLFQLCLSKEEKSDEQEESV